MLSAIIFDLDMTLVDSLSACAAGANLLAGHFGLPEKSEAEVLKALSLPTKEFWVALWGRYESRWPSYFDEVVVPKVFKMAKLFPDTIDILSASKRKGYLLGLATNRANPWRDLAAYDMAKWFDTAVGATDVPRPKPDPDMALTVVKQLGVEPSRTIYVGDSPADMACARSAGIKALGLLQGGCDQEALLAAGADLIRPTLGACREALSL
jgi:HAD superfamily hydrolase (TIGR01509 family)